MGLEPGLQREAEARGVDAGIKISTVMAGLHPAIHASTLP
jgi:hypothetical protein